MKFMIPVEHIKAVGNQLELLRCTLCRSRYFFQKKYQKERWREAKEICDCGYNLKEELGRYK
jgi:hypothetical protein